MRISDWSSDVCSSDLLPGIDYGGRRRRVSRLREALVLRTADAVTAASAPILDSLEKLGISAHRVPLGVDLRAWRSEEHTSELQSLMRISYAVFCLKKKNNQATILDS